MKKLLAVALIGIAALGLTTSRASAGWRDKHSSTKTFRVNLKITATQYNAFSPWCIESVKGKVPEGYNVQLSGPHGCCGHAGCPHGVHHHHGHAMMQMHEGSYAGHAVAMPADGVDGATMQPWSAWGPGMVDATGVPTNYPGLTGMGR